MDKYHIFDHLSASLVSVATKGNFKTMDTPHKALITHFASPLFNYVSLGQWDEHLIQDLTQQKTPFICMPQKAIEQDFHPFCEKMGLLAADDVIAHEFTDLETWTYNDPSPIQVREVKDLEDLHHFDAVSSQAFVHPKEMAVQFLEPILNHPEITLFLAFDGSKPVGCGMASFVNNIAGLYWGGVLPEYRRKGIGTTLTQYRMNFAKQKGFKSIYAQNMTPSIGYYQKIGFKPVGALPLYVWVG